MGGDSVKRIMAEVRELSALNGQPGSFFFAEPMESDLFEWHFSVRGPPDTPFETGIYHGRILLPPEYPLKAPEIILLTPNGRFEVGKRICLSVTSHHDETWQPSWGIRTILTALVGFMPSKSHGLGALDYPADTRRSLAKKSHSFVCPRCGAKPAEQFPDLPAEGAGASSSSAPPSGTPQCEGGEDAKEVTSEPGSSSTDVPIAVAGAPEQPSATGSAGGSASAVPQDSGEKQENSVAAANAREAPRENAAVAQDASRRLRTVTRHRNHSRGGRQEIELYYLALAIVAAILAIVGRRVLLHALP